MFFQTNEQTSHQEHILAIADRLYIFCINQVLPLIDCIHLSYDILHVDEVHVSTVNML